MTPLIEESTRDDTSWERRIHLLEQLHTLLDDEMVRLGLVSPHPKFKPHESSGYRLLERGYRELLRAVPKELADHTPRCDQIFLEQFVTGYVAGLDEDPWLKLLNLEPE